MGVHISQPITIIIFRSYLSAKKPPRRGVNIAGNSITEKNIPTISEVQSSIIITFGAILGSISFSGQISVEALAVVFLVINPGWVLFSTYQRKLKMLRINEKQNDSINIRFWNVIFACIISVIIVLFYDIL